MNKIEIRWNVHIQVSENVYKHYRQYLKDEYGIIPAGQYANIKKVTTELIETIMDLAGEGQKIDLDEMIEKIVGRVKTT